MVKPLVPAVVSAVLLLAGCGSSGDDEPSAAVASASASTAAASPSASSDTPTSAASSSPTTPVVTPATGRTIKTLSMTFTAPRGFEDGGAVGNGLVSQVQVNSKKCLCSILASGLANLNSEDLEGAADVLSNRGTRQPDLEVGGQPALLFVKEARTSRTYTVASIAGGQIATLAMVFTTLDGLAPQGQTPETERALLDSVLATVQWKA